ncbi:MAG: hypothetical protein ABIC36_02850 [bacterium]
MRTKSVLIGLVIVALVVLISGGAGVVKAANADKESSCLLKKGPEILQGQVPLSSLEVPLPSNGEDIKQTVMSHGVYLYDYYESHLSDKPWISVTFKVPETTIQKMDYQELKKKIIGTLVERYLDYDRGRKINFYLVNVMSASEDPKKWFLTEFEIKSTDIEATIESFKKEFKASDI